MINVRLYSSKASKLKRTFFFSLPLEKVEVGSNNLSIPVIVVDLQTNKSVKYASINKAARSLAAHPKTIWRKVQNKQPYLERYLIMKKDVKYNKIYIKVIEYFNVILKLFFNNYTMIFYILLLAILFGYILYKCIIIFYTDVYSNNINNLDKTKVVLEQKYPFKKDFFNYIRTPISHKIKGLAEFNEECKSIYILKNKTSFIQNFPSKPTIGIYQSIMNEINLDFQSKTNVFSTLNSTHSSPVIERVNINNIFSNAIASTRPTTTIAGDVSSNNSLVINTQSLYNNRNYSIIDNVLIWPSTPGRELLNYNSNVLYCLINGISPSTY